MIFSQQLFKPINQELSSDRVNQELAPKVQRLDTDQYTYITIHYVYGNKKSDLSFWLWSHFKISITHESIKAYKHSICVVEYQKQ